MSRAGIIPISHTQDTAGPMARSVADAAVLLTALAGADPRDPATADGGPHAADFTRFLDPAGLRGARIGVARNMAGFHPDTRPALRRGDRGDEAARAPRSWTPRTCPTIEDLGDPEFEVLLYEFKAGLEAYLAALGPKAPVKTLADADRLQRARTATGRCRTSARRPS